MIINVWKFSFKSKKSFYFFPKCFATISGPILLFIRNFFKFIRNFDLQQVYNLILIMQNNHFFMNIWSYVVLSGEN